MSSYSVERTQATRRVVVLGGAGFLGSHLCEALLVRGAQVVCVDNFITGSRNNLVEVQHSNAFELMVADISEGSIQTIEGPIDAVFHLASPASPVDYLAHPLETLAAGSEGTRQALTLSTTHGSRFILASTSEVYGEPNVHPQTETYWGNVNPVGPRSVYDESKRFAEALTMAWHRSIGTDVGIARIFNTYGPRMRHDDGRVVPNFLTQALAGAPLTVYGDGSQTRSLCFVEDMVKGLLALLDSRCTGPINLGNPAEHTVRDLAQIVLDLTKSSSVVTHGPLPIDDPTRRCPDITLARQHLHWEPAVSLVDGLTRTANSVLERNLGASV